MEMIIFMVILIIWGAWTKRQNTLYMRKLAWGVWERYRDEKVPFPQDGKPSKLPLFHRRSK